MACWQDNKEAGDERRHTLSSILAQNRACSLDITGLSNQALSIPATKPFVDTFDARPTVMVPLALFRVMRRSGKRTSLPEDGSADMLSSTAGEAGLVTRHSSIRTGDA